MAGDLLAHFNEKLKEAHPELQPETVTRLFSFYELLNKYNDSHDLSRLKKTEEIITKHFVDSVIIDALTELPHSLLDIGTGAGFPGIPIAIIRDDIEVILAEPRPLRVEFMELAITKLGLSNCKVFPHKVNEKMVFPVEGIITRAFEDTNSTLKRAVNFLPLNGRIILLKGPGVEEELNELDDIKEHYNLIDDIHYTLPKTSHERRLVIFQKDSNYRKRFFLFSEIPELSKEKLISSKDNTHFKNLKKTVQKGGNKKTGLTLFSGAKIISELCKSKSEILVELIVYELYETSDAHMLDVIDFFEKKGKLTQLKKSLFNEIDTSSTNQPLCVIKTPEIQTTKLEMNGELIVAALPFQDPVNLGSAVRSASAFGINSILLTSESCNPFHPKSIRSSSGTVFSTHFIQGPPVVELHSFCEQHDLKPVALDSSGTDIADYSLPDRMLLIAGIEGPGLPDSLKKDCVAIPISSDVESLNASISISIIFYELMRKKHQTGMPTHN
jgi:16S rRNA (guanine527-N7)-methyltransferase